ncbi:MAG: GNAT family N-acetyltransferase [Clostridia bacterium]|nr:GNAT family N-acetyltransferase [Clostridia bacterium]
MRVFDLIVRPAVPGDSADIREICGTGLGYDCEEELVNRRLENIGQGDAVFVAETNGKAVGFVHAECYRCLYFEDALNILGLAVLPEYRRNGIGRMLMDAVEDHARIHGIAVIRLNSGASRTGAHAFYRSIGYDNEKDQIRFLKYLN